MDGESGSSEDTVDLGGGLYILLERSRAWPKYVVSWSVRRRDAQHDYPLAIGSVSDLPSKTEPEGTWDTLRAQALAQAQNAATAQPFAARRRGGVLSRLFGR